MTLTLMSIMNDMIVIIASSLQAGKHSYLLINLLSSYTTLYTVHDLNCTNIIKMFHDIFPSSKAEELGTYLNISKARLDEFSICNIGNPQKLMVDVLNHWLNNDKKKSWKVLADAVEFCGYKVLATKIRTEHEQSFF